MFNENVSSICSESIIEPDSTMDTPMSWTMYAMCVIATIGIPANLLTLVILLQPSTRIQSTFIYLAAIAVADTGVLVFWLLGDMNGFEIVHLGDHIFNIRISNMFCQLLSCWLLWAVNLDRYIFITHPLCTSVMRNTTGALIAISVIALLCGAITVFANFSIKIQDISIFTTMDKATSAFTTGVAFVALLALISFIIYKMCNISVTRESVLLPDGAGSEQMKTADEPGSSRTELDKITFILLITTFSFLMLTLPFPTIIFMSRYMCVEVFRDVCNILWYSNFAVKMFLYSLSGKRFREKMVNLLRSAFNTCIVK